jgi:hypothetical protein
MTAWLMWPLVGLGIWFAVSVISAFLVGHLLSHRAPHRVVIVVAPAAVCGRVRARRGP